MHCGTGSCAWRYARAPTGAMPGSELPLREPTALERQLEAAYVRRYGYDPIEETEQLLDRTFTRSAVMWSLANWL